MFTKKNNQARQNIFLLLVLNQIAHFSLTFENCLIVYIK